MLSVTYLLELNFCFYW